MDVGTWIAQLESDGLLLAEAADRAGWDAPVPGTEWDVRALVTHTGGVHRWAEDSVRTGAQGFGTPADRAIGSGPPDDELLDWFRAGHEALVATLRVMPENADVFTFLPAPDPRAFWCRRQAHETAIHRADAQDAAGGPVTPFPAQFAQDGIDELIDGFAARRTTLPGDRIVLAFRIEDGPGRQVVLADGQVSAGPVPAAGWANAVVHGTSSDLYLWCWNRRSNAEIRGDVAAAAVWREIRVK